MERDKQRRACRGRNLAADSPDRRSFKGTLAVAFLLALTFHSTRNAFGAETEISIDGTRWLINGKPTNAGTTCEGLLMNVRMVNATFEDQDKRDFEPEKNCGQFVAKLADYAAHGVNACTLNLQGGMPGYEGAMNSAFQADGSLRADYLRRVEHAILACDQNGMVVILGLFYQRQSTILRDEVAVQAGVVNAVRWIQSRDFRNVVVCNEDDRTGRNAVAALRATVECSAGYGLMLKEQNQTFPFHFDGAADDPIFYAALKELTTVSAVELTDEEATKRREYFPPPESQGGWRAVENEDEIETIGGMDKAKIAALRQWLIDSDNRPFAAVVIRHGTIVLQVERGNSAVTDSRRVASVSKAVCATVLAIASEQSRQGRTPRRMIFDDKAFEFIPWAKPLSDPRKADITVKQLLNHTSGICPEATGARNDGPWNYILGHSDDPRTEKLAFDPGTQCGYSTHAMVHASLVCETVTGKPYDEFAIEALFKPIGIEKWWFQYYDGGTIGKKPSHGLGMPARELARIGYCMLHDGRWNDQQVIPKWFVDQTAQPSHHVTTPELRWKLNPAVFTLGWELPARHFPESGKHIAGIPFDARYKPGSGGQLLAFVPSLDLVIARQTGGSGQWDYEEYLRRACGAVLRNN